jgi:hypothetical protein
MDTPKITPGAILPRGHRSKALSDFAEMADPVALRLKPGIAGLDRIA